MLKGNGDLHDPLAYSIEQIAWWPLVPAYQTFIDQFMVAEGEASIAQDLVGVKVADLKASFDEMHARYGTIEAYLADSLVIGAAGQ